MAHGSYNCCVTTDARWRPETGSPETWGRGQVRLSWSQPWLISRFKSIHIHGQGWFISMVNIVIKKQGFWTRSMASWWYLMIQQSWIKMNQEPMAHDGYHRTWLTTINHIFLVPKCILFLPGSAAQPWLGGYSLLFGCLQQIPGWPEISSMKHGLFKWWLAAWWHTSTYYTRRILIQNALLEASQPLVPFSSLPQLTRSTIKLIYDSTDINSMKHHGSNPPQTLPNRTEPISTNLQSRQKTTPISPVLRMSWILQPFKCTGTAVSIGRWGPRDAVCGTFHSPATSPWLSTESSFSLVSCNDHCGN